MTAQFKKVIIDAAEEMNKLNAMDVSEPTKIDHSNLTVITCGEVEEPKQEEVKKVSHVRFLMYKVTNGTDSVKVWYSPSVNQAGELIYITVYADSYAGDLTKIFDNVINDSDIMTDYFEHDRVKIDPTSPHWTACKAAYDKVQESQRKRREKRMAKYSK